MLKKAESKAGLPHRRQSGATRGVDGGIAFGGGFVCIERHASELPALARWYGGGQKKKAPYREPSLFKNQGQDLQPKLAV